MPSVRRFEGDVAEISACKKATHLVVGNIEVRRSSHLSTVDHDSPVNAGLYLRTTDDG
jgi:hypothetical protein